MQRLRLSSVLFSSALLCFVLFCFATPTGRSQVALVLEQSMDEATASVWPNERAAELGATNSNASVMSATSIIGPTNNINLSAGSQSLSQSAVVADAIAVV